MLTPVPTTAVVPTVSPVVQIKSAERDVTSVRMTPSAERASSAVTANVSVVILLVPVRPTTSVILERIVVGECVCPRAFGTAGLLPAPLLAPLSSLPSSFPLHLVAAVLVARITAIVHLVLWSSLNGRNNSSSQPRHTR